VWENHELRLLRFLEDNFELSGFAFDVETVFIAGGEHAALEILEGGVRPFAESLFRRARN